MLFLKGVLKMSFPVDEFFIAKLKKYSNSSELETQELYTYISKNFKNYAICEDILPEDLVVIKKGEKNYEK